LLANSDTLEGYVGQAAGVKGLDLTHRDELETLYAFSGFHSKWGLYEPEERE